MVSRSLGLPLALAASLVAGLGSTAHAHGVVGYGVGVGYSPAFGPDTTMPALLVLNNQYYDFSVSGVADLCKSQPAFCASPTQQDFLSKLERNRAAGWVLELVGMGVMLGGPLLSMAKSCQNSDALHRCEPNWSVVAGSVGTGILLGIVGAAISPDPKDVMQFVNQSNADHPDAPIRLQVGLLGGGRTGGGVGISIAGGLR